MIKGWDHEESTVLLDRAYQGDDAAFGTLYRRVSPMARRAAHNIVRDSHAADDLVQETFYLVLRAVRSGRGPRDSFTGYVLATVKHLAYRYCRTESRMVANDDPDMWERHADIVVQPPAQAERATAAWASLPPRWRSILWLVEVDRYSPAELAAGLSLTPNAVSSLASRARQALRTAYSAAD
ncbi:RNA polymerase sigma factor [Jiangella alkaliphila]|uniref:RNA polymerase sigma factor, sigma-70 family n=2 Tax=Jiangella alkaliphila TaxID=419479 RepID=A0A1H2GPM9_9ACTN|nr:sigma-70 family RNA polymerase sigma factor [Jiangella alkaliphila]SDU21656.1 RNA polymerase sigma factor, sigma-70 family [Jiangella alkaliphila]